MDKFDKAVAELKAKVDSLEKSVNELKAMFEKVYGEPKDADHHDDSEEEEEGSDFEMSIIETENLSHLSLQELKSRRDSIFFRGLENKTLHPLFFNKTLHDSLSSEAFCEFCRADRACNEAFYNSVVSTLPADKWVLIINAEVRGTFDTFTKALIVGTRETEAFPFDLYIRKVADGVILLP